MLIIIPMATHFYSIMSYYMVVISLLPLFNHIVISYSIVIDEITQTKNNKYL